MSIVLDKSHGYEIILVLWRIDDCTAVRMVADLVKADFSVTDTADSVLRRSNIGLQACIAEDANVRVVVKGIVVETIGSRTLSLDDLRNKTTGSVPGLGGVLSGASISGTGRTALGFSFWPPWDMYSVSDCSDDYGGVTRGFSLSDSSRAPPPQDKAPRLDGRLCGFHDWPGNRIMASASSSDS